MNKNINETTLSASTKQLLKESGFSCTEDLAIHFYYNCGVCNIKGIGKKKEQEIETYLTKEGWRCRPDGFERLYFAIFGKPEKNEILAFMFRSPESNALFNDALLSLTDREKFVVMHFYGICCERLSIDDIGKECCASRERVKQIMAKAIRKLRSTKSPNLRNVKYSWRELALLHDSEQRELRCLAEEIRELRDIIEKAGLPTTKVPHMLIYDMNLSVRSYNCLKHAGIYTAAQLARMSSDDIYQIRNLGRHCAEEVIEKLKELGVELAS